MLYSGSRPAFCGGIEYPLRPGRSNGPSAHPKFAVNMGTGGDEAEAREGVIAHNLIHHTATQPSRLVLTVPRSE